ncbi:MAG: hypothetical protein EOO46_18135 [Flavobacterium sp.]|nr:MAG: hypothetical protein EOO46_18135 [Flavobacterium sp.]
MKNLILLLSFFTILSCGSDDDAPADISVDSITGLWKVVSSTADGFTFDYVDCDTPVAGMEPLIGVYDFKADGTVDISSMCKPEDGTLTTSYSFEDSELSMVLNNDVEWKAKATALPDNKFKFDFFWNSDEGAVSGQSIIVQRTTAEEVAAGGS